MKYFALAALLTGCVTSKQGQYYQTAAVPTPLPATVPQFPRPSHTPAGAGASAIGQPWQSPGPPRSPNRRILPPSPEPGLWAADEKEDVTRAGQDDIPAAIAGVKLPSPRKGSTADTRRCAISMGKALAEANLYWAMNKLHPGARECVAARLFEYCAIRRAFQLHNKLTAAGIESSRALDRREETVGVAVAFARRVCNEETYPREASAIFNAAADKWTELNRMTRDDR